jgi:hypothetical protein
MMNKPVEPNPYESPKGPLGRSSVEWSVGRAILLLVAPFASLATAIASYHIASVARRFADEVFNGADDVFLVMVIWPMIVLPPVAVFWIMLRYTLVNAKWMSKN